MLFEFETRMGDIIPGFEGDVVHAYVCGLSPRYREIVRVEGGLEEDF